VPWLRRSFCPERALPVLREWRAAIEALGFARCAAARLPTVHVLAFRATPAPAPPQPLLPMRIAYDARVPGAPQHEVQ
jgi:25S rRNA (adenine2142-N1)-methyltransferase